MPGMDGPTLIVKLRERRPELKALLVSGYSSDAVATRGFANVKALFLEKPFSLAGLSAKVREALDGGTTTFL
jgi:DNA-binding NtrC family response regulator